MKASRKLNRRSFLAQVAAGGVAGGALLTISGNASAFQVTDSDPSDPVGRGRGGGTGITDADAGPGADPGGRGRGGNRSAPQAGSPQGSTGVTDSDTGVGADPIGRGRRGSTGVTDSDAGPGADPGGRGRGVVRPPSSGQPPTDCVSHRVRLNSLEALTERPDGWSEERLARARTEMLAMRRYYLQNERGERFSGDQSIHIWTMARAHGITNEAIQNNQEWRGSPLSYLYQQIASRIDQAVAATAQRAELHRQIAYHRSVLAAAGCR